jgi:hypothetical protein
VDGQVGQVVEVRHSRIIAFIFPAIDMSPFAAALAIFTSAPGIRKGSACSPHPHSAHLSHNGADRGMTSPPSGCSKMAYRPRSAGSGTAG